MLLWKGHPTTPGRSLSTGLYVEALPSPILELHDHRMTSLRSRRLEALLGAAVDDLDLSNLQSLVDAHVREDFDLDFKGARYGTSDADKRALQSDVAALANADGGLIIIGVAEDEHAQASALSLVELGDAEMNRMRQIIAGVLPTPRTEIYPLADDQDRGCFVIAIPRSPLAPHAVPVNEGLRYPVRHGATTRYLSEPEVAAAYRRRDVAAKDQLTRLEEVERSGLLRLNPTQPWVAVTAVPELVGDMPIDMAALHVFQSQILGRRGNFALAINVEFTRVGVGQRRLLADGSGGQNFGNNTAQYLSLDAHRDGATFWAAQLWGLDGLQDSPVADADVVSDEVITQCILEGLLHAGHNATARTHAGGTVAIRVRLLPALGRLMALGEVRRGYPILRGQTLSGESVTSETFADVDDLGPSPALLQSAKLLSDEIAQSFGIPEMGQFTAEGAFAVHAWHGSRAHPVIQWGIARGLATD